MTRVSARDRTNDGFRNRSNGLMATIKIIAATAGIGGTDSPIWVAWVIRPLWASQILLTQTNTSDKSVERAVRPGAKSFLATTQEFQLRWVEPIKPTYSTTDKVQGSAKR